MFYNSIKTNFHTHTKFCGHAVGLPSDYVEKIESCGIQTIGFSEHAYIDIPSFKHTIKSPEDMNMYYQEVDKLNSLTNINVLIGLEIDYFPSFIDYYKVLKEKFDYLSLSIHFVDINGSYSYATRFTNLEEINMYCEYMESGIKSGLFAYINHPDLFLNQHMNNYRTSGEIIAYEKKIIDIAIKYNIPLELNINQFKRFNELYKEDNIRNDFWKLVGETNIEVLINFDAHNPDEISLDIYNVVVNYAKKHKLNIISDFRKSKNNECN